MATILDSRLTSLGWGTHHFRRVYSETGRRLNHPTASVSEKQVRRWRTGQLKTLPRGVACDILADIFGLPAERLLAMEPDPQEETEEDVYRREVLRGALATAAIGAAAPAIAALESARRAMDAALETTRVGPATLERWERAAHDYASAYQITPPRLLLPDIVSDFAEVRALLECPQPVRVRVGLCRAGAQLAVLAGVCLSALGLDREARGWLHTARLAAEESGDMTLTGQAVARSAIVALYYGSPAGAMADAVHAEQLLGTAPCPALVRSRIVQARAHARLGHTGEALAALDLAAAAHGALAASDTMDTAFGYTLRQFQWHVANALTSLGRIDEARPLQRSALAAYRPSERLDPALIALDQAAAVLREGDPQAAAQGAARVWIDLPAEHRTGMVARYIWDLLAAVPAAAADLPEVRMLGEMTGATRTGPG